MSRRKRSTAIFQNCPKRLRRQTVLRSLLSYSAQWHSSSGIGIKTVWHRKSGARAMALSSEITFPHVTGRISTRSTAAIKAIKLFQDGHMRLSPRMRLDLCIPRVCPDGTPHRRSPLKLPINYHLCCIDALAVTRKAGSW